VSFVSDKPIDKLNENELDEFEDVFSSSDFDVLENSDSTPYEDDFSDEDIPDFSGLMKPRPALTTSELLDEFGKSSPKPAVKRKSQDIQYDDINQIYAQYIPEKKKKKGHHPVRNAFIVVLCLFIALSSVFGYLAINKLNGILSSAKQGAELVENIYIKDEFLYSNSMQTSILLIGLDATDNKADADSITMLTMDHKNGEFKLTVFLPDTYIQIANESAKTLSEMYSLKGVQGLVDALELNFKVNIPHYIIFDHASIKPIVDNLGGISIKITPVESEQIGLNVSDNLILNGDDATKLLNGEEGTSANTAVAQRKVLSAIVKKVISQELKDFAKAVEGIAPHITTNISSGKLKNLFLDTIEYETMNYVVCDMQVPADGNLYYDSIDGVGNCTLTDINQCSKALKDFLMQKQH
jgi:anionic cell wall polymer biosynthesis LytR-Cps2A-Psr (LCP) family protein